MPLGISRYTVYRPIPGPIGVQVDGGPNEIHPIDIIHTVPTPTSKSAIHSPLLLGASDHRNVMSLSPLGSTRQGTIVALRPARAQRPMSPASSGPISSVLRLIVVEVSRLGLTPTAKKRVRAREPKYAREKGNLSAEQICFTSTHQLSMSDYRIQTAYDLVARARLRSRA